MARKKTRAEKIQSGYRLQHFRLTATERGVAKDASEFGYLSREYVEGDLKKTLIITLVILSLLLLAQSRLL